MGSLIEEDALDLLVGYHSLFRSGGGEREHCLSESLDPRTRSEERNLEEEGRFQADDRSEYFVDIVVDAGYPRSRTE